MSDIYHSTGIAPRDGLGERADQALRETEELFRDLVENSGILMGAHDEEGRILAVNRATVELAGVQSAEEMLGRKISEFLTPETRHLFDSYLETVLREGRAEGLMRVRTGAGEERILEYRNSLRRKVLEKPIVRCIGRDVTDQKRAEKALRESEARYRLLAENAQDLIALVEPTSRILYASPSHLHVLGYPPEAFVGECILQFIHTEDAASVYRLIQALVQSGGRRRVDLRLKKIDGIWLQFEAILSAITDATGTASRLLVAARDVTERKQAEQSLHRISGRLIQLQDNERRHIARELHDSTAQILAAISMNLQVANDSAAEIDARVRNALSESASLTSQCLREIRTLCYLLHPPQPDDFGFASALRCYVAGFAKRSGIAVRLDAPPEFPHLSQPLEVTLFRILQEGLSNVHRHSRSSTADVRVDVTGQWVKLELRDQGRGIPASILAHLNEGHVDLGVGIAGMRERVRQFGGTLEIASDDKGTSVCASLPLHSIGLATEESSGKGPAVRHGSRQIDRGKLNG